MDYRAWVVMISILFQYKLEPTPEPSDEEEESESEDEDDGFGPKKPKEELDPAASKIILYSYLSNIDFNFSISQLSLPS